MMVPPAKTLKSRFQERIILYKLSLRYYGAPKMLSKQLEDGSGIISIQLEGIRLSRGSVSIGKGSGLRSNM